MMTKEEMTKEILTAKIEKKLSWAALSEATNLGTVCIAAACLGSASLTTEEAKKVTNLLELPDNVAFALTEFPTKGNGQVVPSDPFIYRFFEIAYVYGDSMKSVAQELFGDGIMSAIDFTLDVDKVKDPKGDRVKITMNGKFLPYKKW